MPPTGTLYPPSIPAVVYLSEAERAQALKDILKDALVDDFWIFAYGSLIWKKDFVPACAHKAKIFGHHRKLCAWSVVSRGTPAKPGLTLGLSKGGSCSGYVYRIEKSQVFEVMKTLLRREMAVRTYKPTWVFPKTQSGKTIKAITFVMREDAFNYARQLPPEVMKAVLNEASGKHGTCLDYVVDTLNALHDNGIPEKNLTKLVRSLTCSPDCPRV